MITTTIIIIIIIIIETLFIFECTIVNLATYRQFTNVEIGLSIKTKKTKN